MRTIMQDLYGKKKMGTKTIQTLLDKVDSHCGETVSLATFAEFCKAHTSMLLPAFNLQRALRKSFCGEQYWESMTVWRRTNKDQKFAYTNWRHLQQTLMELDEAVVASKKKS
eukprot:gb/GECG01008455.1/.p1 GENE.gb/GECG01008455.1/~~gb/GECG01008455.1/.p1  ORF type:complete len:112 (+),score=14.08 gb/GECG01008455.1/:1-336(+)